VIQEGEVFAVRIVLPDDVVENDRFEKTGQVNWIPSRTSPTLLADV
jgi:hypothetical protein